METLYQPPPSAFGMTVFFSEDLTNYTNMTAQSTFDTLQQLGTFLIVKYNDGVVKRVKDGKFERNSIGQPAGVMRPGYPKEFLQEYVKQTGDRYKVPQE